MKTTAVVKFAQSSASGRPFALEQKPWPDKSAANFGAWLDARSLDPTPREVLWYYEQYKSDCAGNGELVATLRVRLLDLATPYVVRASYGEVGQAVYISEGRTEYLAYELSTAQSVDFGVIQSAVWNGDVYDAEGNIVTAPTVTLSGLTATVAAPVYGVLEVQVVEELYEHTLTITARTPTPEQAQRIQEGDNVYAELYAATAMLFCNQQISLLDIDMPDNFGNCSGAPSSRGSTGDDQDDDSPDQWYSVVFHAFDACKGSALQGAEYWVDGVKVIGGQGLYAAGRHSVRAVAPGYIPSDEDDLSENDYFDLPAGS